MKLHISFEEALELMLSRCKQTAVETVDISESYDRISAADISAVINIPPFPRSQFDGYAFIAADTAAASRENPVTLEIIGETAAGFVSRSPVKTGQAVKILTGAPIPEGADTVVKYETTSFTADIVTIFEPAKEGDYIPAGEDIKAGETIVKAGELIDPAISAMLAGQGFTSLEVYKKPLAGIISTGTELCEIGGALEYGKIRNTNRYSLEGACLAAGAIPVYIGTANDESHDIAELIKKASETCDIVFITGGVAVGDFDLTPRALEEAGAEMLVRSLNMKPGGACAYGEKDGKLIFCLSGSPAAAMLNFYAVALPVLRKLCGLTSYRNTVIKAALSCGYEKESEKTRLLFGELDISGGTAYVKLSRDQRNGALRSMAHCNVIAIIPQGSPALPEGYVLDAFLVNAL